MKYYTTCQASNVLGYTDDRYVRRLVEKHSLFAEKMGNQWMISEEAIKCFKKGKKLMIIKGGIIKSNRGWHYYFDVTEKAMVYGPQPLSKEDAEELLQAHIHMTQEQKGDDYVVCLQRTDR